eukprot:CAMPEP_0168313954 /NCGR_PEP_ID=MMETSP0210-20121227/5474_1 /TAXON_ID=40633 /ORGANISM="Condylostoma magnum, Strain COL2" /LENGTH=97 /DNA_ID=CAMNT_0008277061 /DNA_START=16 /DNA_END=309 /DNA_ORIENTATION=+
MSNPVPFKIKNKMRRAQLMLKMKQDMKQQRKVDRDKRRKQRDLTGEAPPIQRTIENMRVPDETIVLSDNEEVQEEENNDEYIEYYDENVPPKVLITT